MQDTCCCTTEATVRRARPRQSPPDSAGLGNASSPDAQMCRWAAGDNRRPTAHLGVWRTGVSETSAVWWRLPRSCSLDSRLSRATTHVLHLEKAAFDFSRTL